MKTCALLLLLGTLTHGATAMVHTLRYFMTSSSQVPNFPEYIEVGYVDDLQITHYDSDTKRYVPKQEWMNKVTEQEPEYWEGQTQRCLRIEQEKKANKELNKQYFNVTEGFALDQTMTGCDWDDETDVIRGYEKYASDGEEFLSLDFDTETYVASTQVANMTKERWERNGHAAKMKNYLIHVCAEILKKYVRHGESALKRTELPLVSLLQKFSSAPVTCHATGFYPDRAMLFWTKDGHELPEDMVDPEEILPNGDGTFQTSVGLDLSSVPPEDWDRYECVFQLSGVKEDYVSRLDRTKIRTNGETFTDPSTWNDNRKSTRYVPE
ncbi:class I histocompatibility antigen, F10 alpha chain-like [Eucyclogobius newberryi]|uniref:class I histocompatibility antigen, F10 alpha chain-like n=1 Tax=Eucyclogobius newberryi TaxID=166745 RepID=UPI003B5AC4E0